MTALVKSSALGELINTGSLVKVLDAIQPVAASPDAPPVVLPKPVQMSEELAKALADLPTIIENAVCPTERRALTQDEVTALLRERQVLDTIEAMIEKRKEAQRIAVFNHHDVSAEKVGVPNNVERTADGWYVIKSAVGSPEFDKGFVRTVQENSPHLDVAALERQIGTPLDDADGVFDRSDYLACTTQVRVIDEAKTMLHLRSHPEIVSAIKKAIVPGRKIIKHTIGKVGG